MKKILIIASVAGLAMVSCKKDYVCECTTTSTAPGSTSYTDKSTMVGVSKKTAKANCFKYSSEETSGGVTYVNTTDCKLK